MEKIIQEYLNGMETAKSRLQKASAALAAEYKTAAEAAGYLSTLIKGWEETGYPPRFTTKVLRQNCRRNVGRLLKAAFTEELKGFSVKAKVSGLHIVETVKKEKSLRDAVTGILQGRVAEATLAEILALLEQGEKKAAVKKAA